MTDTTGPGSGPTMHPGDTWSYREDIGSESAAILGFSVEATDGHIGKIDEASNEADSSHLVVDTGWWIFGKKRLIPAGVVTRIDTARHTVYVNLTKAEIKEAPDWNETASMADPLAREPYDIYFRPYR